MMRIGRTLPPAAAPIPLITILKAIPACFERQDRNDGVFEEEINTYFDTKYCFLLSSGKAALTLILRALKELSPDRDEVVIPAFTCFSVPASIKKAGLRITLCDLTPESLDMDQNQLREIMAADKNKRRVLCVLATHLFGCSADMEGIRDAVGPDTPIVEDAAQAMGESFNGRKLGATGDVGFFSLGRGKALSTMEGGIIITSRDDLGGKLDSLVGKLPGYSSVAAFKLALKALVTNFLQKPSLFWLPKVVPFLRLGETVYEVDFFVWKISLLQRRLARNWNARLQDHRKARSENCNYWLKRLPDGIVSPCKSCMAGSMIRLPLLARSSGERDRLVTISEQSGLGIMPAYPSPVNEITAITDGFEGRGYKNSKEVCRNLLTLPVHQLVLGKDNERIAKLLDAGVNFVDLTNLD